MINTLIMVSLAYVAALFLVAFYAERLAAKGKGAWLRSPIIYTLSLSVYCTAWTFYGAVGSAARAGLEFMAIYLGPTLVLIGWWWVLRKIVRIGRSQKITSIADMISSRYGKSNSIAVIVTMMAVIGTTPYIALQLQSVTLSFNTFLEVSDPDAKLIDPESTAFWVAVGLALFTILFGTRNLDANERHHGVVTAIALEAVVKLVALVAVGVFVVWQVMGGIPETFAAIDASEIQFWERDGGRWTGILFVSAAAFIALPRMFQVMVVENDDERHLSMASWAFPTYVMLMSLFVVPIAVAGLQLFPKGANPDLFVLTVPLAQGWNGLAMFAFIGGFSAATSMVIVAAIALSTMVSNHVVMPIWLAWSSKDLSVVGDVRQLVLYSRRVSIAVILAFGYFYLRITGGGAALSSIGLISFAGVAQFLPAMIGGIFWRAANRHGALAGLITGFAVWAFTLFLPSFGPDVLISKEILENGFLGLSWLRPDALFGIEGLESLVHAVFWSISLNTVVFLLVSLVTFPNPMERLQGAQFVNVYDHSVGASSWTKGRAEAEDLLIMCQRIIGPTEAQKLFRVEAERQGIGGYLPETTPGFLQGLERELAGSVGAATAHAMIAQIVGRSSVSVDDLMRVADETAQIMEYSNQLESKSAELAITARKLTEANEKLTKLSVQKDAFLSQVSHELRTPMTSIRAFSEILGEAAEINEVDRGKYAGIIHGETLRLTRLLDDLLDLSVLENGQVKLNVETGNVADVIDQAVAATHLSDAELKITRNRLAEHNRITTDLDRLTQVIINLISNAAKYCENKRPSLDISVRIADNQLTMDFVDNGKGVPRVSQDDIFEKFSRVSDRAVGAGLGLAICREIMTNLGGTITYLPGQGGAAFRVSLPTAPTK
jgi:Na+/proline symporter/nitrogen-specific signal transduction histidine kinase